MKILAPSPIHHHPTFINAQTPNLHFCYHFSNISFRLIDFIIKLFTCIFCHPIHNSIQLHTIIMQLLDHAGFMIKNVD